MEYGSDRLGIPLFLKTMDFKKLANLRRKYPRFVYRDFSWKIQGQNLVIFFDFQIPSDFQFSPKIVIENVSRKIVHGLGQGTIDNFVFNLGLIEMFSYWKVVCAPEIIVEAGYLDNEQIRWWQDLLIKGMGQYFFENKINFRQNDFLKITSRAVKTVKPYQYQNGTIVAKWYQIENEDKDRFLMPLGGGKDSVVTLELLKKAGKKPSCFCVNPSEAVKEIMKIGDCGKPIIVRRQIDPKLLELNRRGFLNGHTPFSALLAFLSSFCAVLFGYKYIAFSNERSANEGNVRYLGQEINHQYSKSFEFEQKFRQYSKKYLSAGLEYFSFLRPLYELQIAKIFSQYPEYFKAFSSCNRYQAGKSSGGKWCGQCPKCLFTFIILRPFLNERKTTEIFGKNLFADKKLLPLMEQLTGKKGFKPFECVGTARETRAALRNGKEIAKILHSWSSQNNLPQGLTKILKGYIL